MFNYMYKLWVSVILKHSMFVAKAQAHYASFTDIYASQCPPVTEGSFGYHWPTYMLNGKVIVGNYVLLEKVAPYVRENNKQ